MAITKEDLVETYNELLPEAWRETSVLSQAGTTNVGWNTTDITKISVGAPSNVDEGKEKPLKDPTIDRFKVKELKLAGILPISNEAEKTPEGQKVIDRAVAEFIAGFPMAVDISVLAGTDPATGAPVARYSAVNLKNNAVAYNSTNVNTVDSAFKAARYGVKARNSRIILSQEGRAQMGALDSAQTGYQKYPQLDLPDASYRGMRVQSGLAVGLDGFEGSDDFIENKVLAYLGDFSKIALAFEPVEVEVSRHATAGGLNAFTQNFTFYRIEQLVHFYIDGPETFGVVKDTSA